MGVASSVAVVAAAMPHAEFLQAAQGKPVANPTSLIGRWMSTPAQGNPQQQPLQPPPQNPNAPVTATTTNTTNVVKALGL